MPKSVDHDERRREIAEAVLRIAAERGLAAVSLREVAAEAGTSMRLVQYYFETKGRMLRHAQELAGAHFGEQIIRRVRETGGRGPREIVRGHLLGLLPLDEETRWLALVSHAFFNEALINTDLADASRAYPPIVQQAIADQISAACSDVDVAHEAAILVCAVRGLIGSVLLGEVTAQQAVDLVDRQLNRIFGAGAS